MRKKLPVTTTTNSAINPYGSIEEPTDVKKHYIHLKPPLDGYNDDKKLSTNFTLGEFRKAMYFTKEEKNLITYVPIHPNIIQACQILRNALGKPIKVNSSFRTVAHELSQGRSGKGKHTLGIAVDLSGEGLVELLREAIEQKNDLYHSLRNLGVNAFGLYKYKNFVHLDLRPAEADGSHIVWTDLDLDEDGKKNSSRVGITLTIIGLVGLAVGALIKKIRP
ncbi:hypothetical protein TPENAI_60771 [Tenacibaculum litopenaei]|uniref:D-Ala-D-Ala carboxypeptidase family metallohydrolase n=1 Tax=Tenacibaculum litopenaei TaxID=396016 RepID=UPI003895F7E0